MPINYRLDMLIKFLIVFLLKLIECNQWASNYHSMGGIHIDRPKSFNIGAVLHDANSVSQFLQAIQSVNSERNVFPSGLSMYPVSQTIVSNPIRILQEFCEKTIKSQVYAVIVDDAGSSEASAISQTCNFFNIPVIGLSNRESALSNKRMHSVYLRTVPPFSHQVDIWIQMLIQLNYTHVVFIHSSDYDGRTTFTRFQGLAEKNNIQIRSIIEYEPGVTDITEELEEADEQIQVRVYLLYTNAIDAQSIFIEVTRLNMTIPGYVWIVSESALKATNVPDGVLALRLFNATGREGHIIDAVYIIGKALGDMRFNDNITQPPSHCGDLNRKKWESGPVFFNHLRKQFLPYGKTGRVAFDNKGDRIDADYEIINTVHGRQVVVGSYAFSESKMIMQLGWNINSIIWPGYQTVKPLGYVRPSHLRVVTLEEEPFIWAEEAQTPDECTDNHVPCLKYEGSQSQKVYCCYGYCIDFLMELSKRLNFTYTLYQVSDGVYGSFNHLNGSDHPKKWTGLVGDLVYKKADMIVAPLTITPERSLFIEFSKPFKYQGITILEKRQPRRASLASFLQPFEESLWLLVMVSVHIVALALYLLDRFSPFGRYRLPNSEVTEEDALNLSSAIWFAWGVLLNSGIGEGTPRSFSGRVLGMVWAGFAMIVVASYTANLAAFLVLDRPATSLAGVNDPRLRNPSEQFTFATVKDSAVEMYFKRQVELDVMYTHMKQRNYDSVEEGILALKSEQISAFIWDSARSEYEASKDCELVTASEQFGRSGYGIGLQKNSFLTEQINAAILSMHESGLMEDLDVKWIFRSHDDKCVKSETVPTTLGLRNMAGVFILVGVGIVGGIGLIVIEVVYKKRQVRQQRQLESARGAMEKWKKLVERRRIYRANLYQIRQQQLFQQEYEKRREKLHRDECRKQEIFKEEQRREADNLRKLEKQKEEKLCLEKRRKEIQLAEANKEEEKRHLDIIRQENLRHESLRHEKERREKDRQDQMHEKSDYIERKEDTEWRTSSPYLSTPPHSSTPYTVERGLNEIKQGEHKGSLKRNIDGKTGSKRKEKKKHEGTHRRVLAREAAVRSTTPDDFGRETPSPRIKPPHTVTYQNRPYDYSYNYGYTP